MSTADRDDLLLLKRYKECLGLNDKPPPKDEDDSISKHEKLHKASKFLVDSVILKRDTKMPTLDERPDSDGISEGSPLSDPDSDTNENVKDANDAKEKKKPAAEGQHTIFRPIPTNPFHLNVPPQPPFTAHMTRDHPGLLTFLDEAKRRAALAAANVKTNGNGMPSALTNAPKGTSPPVEKKAKLERPLPHYPNAEFRRTSAPACLWSASSLFNNNNNNSAEHPSVSWFFYFPSILAIIRNPASSFPPAATWPLSTLMT